MSGHLAVEPHFQLINDILILLCFEFGMENPE